MAEVPQPRLRRGEFATAVWAIALLVVMFAVKWYGVDNLPGRNRPQVSALDAWNGLSVVRWVMLATILLAIGSVALHLSQGDHGTQTDTSRPLAWASTLVAVLHDLELVRRRFPQTLLLSGQRGVWNSLTELQAA